MPSIPISLRKVTLYGVVSWVVPFAVGAILIGRNGQPRIPIGVFKSLMIVVGSAVGAWLLVRVFRRRPAFKHPGLVVGFIWLGINIVLDLLILVPLARMNLSDYFGEIALRYLVIPIMAVAIGDVAAPSEAGV
jgi:uncharacterized membrane protein YpjA